jgi:hypothetical protein
VIACDKALAIRRKSGAANGRRTILPDPECWLAGITDVPEAEFLILSGGSEFQTVPRKGEPVVFVGSGIEVLDQFAVRRVKDLQWAFLIAGKQVLSVRGECDPR